MEDHPIIEQYLAALEALRAKEPLPFARTMRQVPDEAGLYMLANTEDINDCYYIGLSKGMRSSISYFSDGSSAGSTMIADLISRGLIQSKRDAKDWTRTHVAVRWLESSKNPTEDSRLHHFLIAVLEPRYNEDKGYVVNQSRGYGNVIEAQPMEDFQFQPASTAGPLRCNVSYIITDANTLDTSRS